MARFQSRSNLPFATTPQSRHQRNFLHQTKKKGGKNMRKTIQALGKYDSPSQSSPKGVLRPFPAKRPGQNHYGSKF
jgi:hypothetical protein